MRLGNGYHTVYLLHVLAIHYKKLGMVKGYKDWASSHFPTVTSLPADMKLYLY